jgi:DDE superfamily endonuclease
LIQIVVFFLECSKSTQTFYSNEKVTKSTETQTDADVYEEVLIEPTRVSTDGSSVPDDFSESQNQQEESCSSFSDAGLDSSYSDAELDSSFSDAELEDASLPTTSYEYRNRTISIMKANCRLYTGIPPYSWNIVDKISRHSGIEEMKILIILRKLKLNEPLRVLGHFFELSVAQISKIIYSNIAVLAEFFRAFIFWPTRDAVKLNVPTNFLRRYKNVQSIIDCFEVKIDKPSQALIQSLSYSDYKSANTVKYLISSTPCGFINFISNGYLGRISDRKITEVSGFLDALPDGADVMADRGFKHIESLLLDKKCKLIKPPSKSGDSKFNKSDARQTKQIASLRTNIERVIARIRHFRIVSSLSVDHNYVDILDGIIVICAAITNWQENIG